MNLIILGKSRSGKDTIAKALGWKNRKFKQFASDWIDSIFGGNFEDTRDHYISPTKTKLDLMIDLYHLLKEYNASVKYAVNHWQMDSKENACYTDVRTIAEALFLAQYRPHVLVLNTGIEKSSDGEFEKILEVLDSYDLPTVYWEHEHPASYNQGDLKQLLERIGYEPNSYRTE